MNKNSSTKRIITPSPPPKVKTNTYSSTNPTDASSKNTRSLRRWTCQDQDSPNRAKELSYKCISNAPFQLATNSSTSPIAKKANNKIYWLCSTGWWNWLRYWKLLKTPISDQSSFFRGYMKLTTKLFLVKN